MIAGVLAGLVFSATFIARSAFDLLGRRAFSLFDDAMIGMIYGRNLARGDGLVWNAGQPAVEGITNPLWTVVMAGVHLVVPDDRATSLAVMVIGAVLLAVGALLAGRIAAELVPAGPVAPAVATWTAALLYPLAFWTLRGMETGLAAVLVLAAALLTLRLADADPAHRARLSGLLAVVVVAGVWTRLDVAVATVVCGLWLAAAGGAHRRHAVVVVVAALAVAVVSQELFRLAYYGELVPNTFTQKIGGVALGTRLERGVAGLGLQVSTSLAPLVLLAVAGLRRPMLRKASLLGGLFVAYAAYSVSTGGDAWEWMGYTNRFLVLGAVALVPVAGAGVATVARLGARSAGALVAAAVVLGALAVADPFPEALLQRDVATAVRAVAPFTVAGLLLVAAVLLGRRRLGPAVAGAFGTVALLAAASGPGLAYWATHNAASVDTDAAMSRYGVLLGELTEPGTSLAVVWAGAPIYFADRPGVDVLGKSDRRIAELEPRPVTFHPGHMKWDYAISVLADRPDVIARLWRDVEPVLPALRDAGYVSATPTGELRRLWLDARSPRILVRTGAAGVRWDRLAVEGL